MPDGETAKKLKTIETLAEKLSRLGVDLPFAIFEIAINHLQEGDCCLRRKHLQHCDTVRSENVRRQIVFKVERTDEFALVNQWQTENGTGAPLNDIGIGRRRTLR